MFQIQHSFPLLYKCQNYDWGKTGTNSLVYQLSHKAGLTSEQESNKPFAELWMGDHPPAASSVKLEDGNSILLNDLISQDPEKYLGKAYAQFGKDGLPFLMKVLSVNKTLSLQVHPDKELAKELHEKQPDVYKDNNYKPEISIALSEFECMCNFREYAEIVEAFKEVPILREFLGEEVVEKFENCAEADRRERMREIIKTFLSKDGNAVKEYTTKLVSYISQKPEKSTRDKLVLKLQEQWPNDIGLLISYMLNHIVLPPGKALIMDPCEPHAYIHGNCIEVMAASDNVIRGCLTPKHIDRETLSRALSCKMVKPRIYEGERMFSHEKDGYEVVKYPTPYEEFTCVKIGIRQQEKETNSFNYNYPSICIVVQGEGSVAVKSETDENFVVQKVKEGESLFFLPKRNIKFKSLSDNFVVFLSTSQSL